ncbi:MAG: type II secretion system protein GspG [Alcanivorax borkumensis]|jgi:general secretion pathway protein G|uniref:Type II secretion system core protein G n=1 Tax=Alcanivorax borkumensis (strain ATCC 700651 / DSM 11573 / NCIMB 13689 / SK2) TaxID=393595 RepID=Q0VPY6_ALCBS|nr:MULTISPECIES: type II secretion system major pseudopilin GspG [Alcanivorax]OJH07750.1 MAG: type II secretion system protein GspG [Alcanivorax borkumensis]EUC71249.1 secretion system protein G [Alcanivorax sp. 97CO-5]PKG02680.1 type II secretion system protein GspG [Alcanivorax sp. 97CO-6]CAL16762.1 general secretion pathway protein GspG [Alcanivorax borkumensis SK2]BAP14237.1 general secretion pathway protein G [Alcanivorax sp. NBRC 101098]
MKAKKAMSGFTLLEIMVVVAIIGLLAAVIVPNVIGQGEAAKVDLTKANMGKIVQQLDLYKFNNGSYPSTEEGLNGLVERPSSARKWPDGGYLPKVPLDAWNNDYVYISPGVEGPFDLLSMGADGVEGGEGADADINWREVQ